MLTEAADTVLPAGMHENRWFALSRSGRGFLFYDKTRVRGTAADLSWIWPARSTRARSAIRFFNQCLRRGYHRGADQRIADCDAVADWAVQRGANANFIAPRAPGNFALSPVVPRAQPAARQAAQSSLRAAPRRGDVETPITYARALRKGDEQMTPEKLGETLGGCSEPERHRRAH